MNVILLGAPGCGKGTQGAILSERTAMPKVATGELLRTAVGHGSELGQLAKSYIDQGLLVPDRIVLGLIEEALEAEEASSGVIMDGFPRTIVQAQAIDRLLRSRGAKVDNVLYFTVPEEELIRRLLGRAGQEGRSDDTEEAIQRRLRVYAEQTEPLISYYQQCGTLTEIQGVGSIEDIAKRVWEALKDDNH
jgi:adenylate kinase